MTIQELINKLQEFEDKDQKIYVWNRYGYYGEVESIEVAQDQMEKPLIIEN